MKATRARGGWRGWSAGVLGGLLLLLIGDRGAYTAPPTGIGIDPFEVLDLQVKNNLLVVLDTSGSMREIPGNTTDIGGDYPLSKLAQAKDAINQVIVASNTKINLGLASLNVRTSQKVLTYDNTGQSTSPPGAPGTGSNRDGPLTYVSLDAAATVWHGFFQNQVNDGNTNYRNGTSANVYRSFEPLAGTFGGRYFLRSRLLRHNVHYKWNRGSGSGGLQNAGGSVPSGQNPCTSPPPAGLFPFDLPGTIRPCFVLSDSNGTGNRATFYYTSATWELAGGTGSTESCGGGAVLETVATCAANNATALQGFLKAELPLVSSGTTPCAGGGLCLPMGLTAVGAGQSLTANVPFIATQQPGILAGLSAPQIDGVGQVAQMGAVAAQSTPMADALQDIRLGNAGQPAFPPLVAGQRNFIVLVTDGVAPGDSTCGAGSIDNAALLAANEAQQLYAANPQVETFVIGVATDSASQARLNNIARAGSGGQVAGSTVTCDATQFPCRDAFAAQNTAQLVAVLNAAIDVASASGIFSATPSVFDGIPEYINTYTLEPGDPNDPDTRYPEPPDEDPGARRAYRSTFQVDGFKGYLRAFGPLEVYGPTGVVPGWEAGQSLMDRISTDLKPPSVSPHTFVGLLDPPSAPTPPGACSGTPGSPCTHINRRIFTSASNGRPPTPATPLTRVMLWPPDTTTTPVVAPAGLTPGLLDAVLLRKLDGTPMVLADMQAAPFKACQGGPTLPPACSSNLTAQATREVREMILAYTAGAEAQRDGSGNPIRDATTGEILYQARSWILSESTLASPAVSVAPLETTPRVHVPEYILYKNGPRTGVVTSDAAAIDRGFGLRNPDTTATQGSRDVKPVMSVVYVPANDMLHAFRAGPNCGGPAPGPSSCPGGEMGGQELWAFVPYDLLPKLKERLKPQTRRDHTFMMASSARFADVFVPGAFTEAGVAYSGKWRRVLLVGRGIGGKHYSGLDITAPGTYTDLSLETNLPDILWNRGNPDTDNGLVGGTRNGSARDLSFYATMGQTWSTPIISRVNPATPFNNKEYVAFVGSGYGVNWNPVTKEYDQVPGEGTRVYNLDPLTGDHLNDPLDVGGLVDGLVPNALVANPVHYAPDLLAQAANRGFVNPAEVAAQSVFLGDLHGRMWKVGTASPSTLIPFFSVGVQQPIATAAALHHDLLGDNVATVFFETGYDARITPGPLFKAYAVRDNNPGGPGNLVAGFPIDFPGAVGDKGPYRGTLQPLTANRADGLKLAFFVATRFNPITGGSCVSSFDSIIFGLNARTGSLVYGGTDLIGVKAVGVPRPPVDGAPTLDQGTPSTSGLDPQTPLPPEREPPGGGGGRQVSTLSMSGTSPVCREQ